jgi:hypothetical protein
LEKTTALTKTGQKEISSNSKNECGCSLAWFRTSACHVDDPGSNPGNRTKIHFQFSTRGNLALLQRWVFRLLSFKLPWKKPFFNKKRSLKNLQYKKQTQIALQNKMDNKPIAARLGTEKLSASCRRDKKHLRFMQVD